MRHETPDLAPWIEHVYWAGDGRVPADATLKFTLLSLKMRKLALEQGGYCVAQQVTRNGGSPSLPPALGRLTAARADVRTAQRCPSGSG
jgi:hypothetical protein